MYLDARPPLPNGTRLRGGEYVIQGCLGAGGFAITYWAWEPRLGRMVAIKEFFPQGCVRADGRVVAGSEWTREAFANYRRRAFEEGRRLAMLRHPGIVAVHAVFEENDTVYLVMEFIGGHSLERHLTSPSGRLSVAEAVDIAAQAAEALTEVHKARLLHRDLKPANLIRKPDGQVVLIDLGAARELLPDRVHTRTVTVTHGYAPLEQYSRDGKLGPYTDVYALAATLYHLLTGLPPVDAPARASGEALRTPRDLSPDVPPALSEAVMRGLSMAPEDRPASAHQFRAEITQPASADVFLIAPRRRMSLLARFVWMGSLGGVVGVMLGLAAGNLAHRSWGGQPANVAASWAISGALAGAGMGVGQWLALARHIRHAWLWPWVTTIGAGAGNVLGWLVGQALGWQVAGDPERAWLVTGAALGAVLGGGQWLVLRTQVRAARLWIGMTMVGKAAGNAASVSIGAATGSGSGQMLGWAVGAIVLVLAQALSLASLQRKGEERVLSRPPAGAEGAAPFEANDTVVRQDEPDL